MYFLLKEKKEKKRLVNFIMTDSMICSLFINVWAPANTTTDSSLPVKVWLYGGANEAGGISNPTYDGCFANENTIQVSISYRVVSWQPQFCFLQEPYQPTSVAFEVYRERSAVRFTTHNDKPALEACLEEDKRKEEEE